MALLFPVYHSTIVIIQFFLTLEFFFSIWLTTQNNTSLLFYIIFSSRSDDDLTWSFMVIGSCIFIWCHFFFYYLKYLIICRCLTVYFNLYHDFNISMLSTYSNTYLSYAYLEILLLIVWKEYLTSLEIVNELL